MALHWIALNCIAFLSIRSDAIMFYLIPLHCIVIYCWLSYYVAIYLPCAISFILAWYCTALHCYCIAIIIVIVILTATVFPFAMVTFFSLLLLSLVPIAVLIIIVAGGTTIGILIVYHITVWHTELHYIIVCLMALYVITLACIELHTHTNMHRHTHTHTHNQSIMQYQCQCR